MEPTFRRNYLFMWLTNFSHVIFINFLDFGIRVEYDLPDTAVSFEHNPLCSCVYMWQYQPWFTFSKSVGKCNIRLWYELLNVGGFQYSYSASVEGIKENHY
jgi:hypothetical protein